MPTEILMPALSPTMEEGTLAKWLVKEGDTVSSGDLLAEIETDKATMEFEAVEEGVIGKILVAEGTEGVKVNTPIAIIGEEGEDMSGATASSGGSAPSSSEEAAPAADEAPDKPASEAQSAPPPPPPTRANASLPRRWPGASPPTRGWILPRSRARGRRAGS